MIVEKWHNLLDIINYNFNCYEWNIMAKNGISYKVIAYHDVEKPYVSAKDEYGRTVKIYEEDILRIAGDKK